MPPPFTLAALCAGAPPLLPRHAARAFFEQHFAPFRVTPDGAAATPAPGFLTGYYEPEFSASLTPSPAFPTPLYGRPADLVTLPQGSTEPGLPAGFQAARRGADGRLAPFPSRQAIEEDAAVAAGWPVIAWLRDPVDRFVMQVQGSARLALPDGAVARVGYAGRNGHPYVSLGRLLSQSEGIPPAEMTMDRLVARLKADPAWTRRFLWNNPSFVFFRLADELAPDQGPIGGAGVPLIAHRSLAADRQRYAYGLPIWLEGALPTGDGAATAPFARLMVVQDTGSAIVGPARFDYFFGSGEAAGFRAGLTRHPVAATLLWPRGRAAPAWPLGTPAPAERP
jgi:membrane-bound lytic murein transglycosylase A